MARPRSTSQIAWLCLGAVALILYGSLYPFDFGTPRAQTLWQALGQLAWARAGRGDRISNLLLYVPLGFCLALWLDARVRGRVAVVAAVLFGASLSLTIEVAQVFITVRVPSWLDVVFNTAGTFAGAVGAIAWRGLSARLPTSLAAEPGGGRLDRIAVLMVAAWVAWHWAPFIPHFTLGKLKFALRPLFDPAASLSDVAHYLVWWAVVAQAIFLLSGAHKRMEMLLTAIAAVLVARLFIVDQFFIPSELIALVLLLPTLVLLHKLWAATRHRILLCAFVAVFVYDRLSGDGNPSTRFDLWPFIAWRDAGWPIDLPGLLKMTFEFTALAWVLREAGLSLRWATSVMAASVLCLEVLALWVPGRDASVTAPAIAFAIAFLLRYLDRERVTRRHVRSR